MSTLIRGLTLALLGLPVAFGIWALLSHNAIAIFTTLLLGGLYGVVWLGCRPSHFIISPHTLKIVFPVWQRRVSLHTVTDVRILDQNAFNQEFGWAIRIGVGGLWGGFGWLWTQRRGFVEFYVSQTDRLVVLDRSVGNTLLITPESLEQFVQTLQENRFSA
ncbi:MAG: hypothetical protein KME16_23380 [Scytolyngbya sp. HA4215-MV1]|jgi:hypothetical protein|nr:hypothetical protein [Scytolyngbya sp. HA4215-MV1]